MDLVSAFRADAGICCFVGAGGKKTTMYTLARRLEHAIVTATVRIPIFDEHVADVSVTEDPISAVSAATARPLGVVPGRDGADRYRGYDPETVARLGEASSDPILVKADGARMRRFKAPGDHEPRIPATADMVVPVVSAHVVGEPLDDRLVHRVDRVAEVGGVSPGSEITPNLVARILTSPLGGHKDVPDEATVIPLVNMVDGPTQLEAGRAIAREILERSGVPHVILAAMREPEPLVEVIDSPSRF